VAIVLALPSPKTKTLKADDAPEEGVGVGVIVDVGVIVGVILGVGVIVGVGVGVGLDPTSKSTICPLNCKIEPLCVIIILII
jgi:hypothetical protein